MIVFWHANNTTLIHNSIGYSFFIQEFISRGVVRVALPLFFILSGYLFFLKIEGSWKEFLGKFKKRFLTLVIPYLFWSLIIFVSFYFAQKLLPQYNHFFGNLLVVNLSIRDILNKIIIDPIPFQFWFIRDLIILVILSPILFYLLKQLKIFIIIILFLTWFLGVHLYIVAPDALLFFSVGAYIAINKSDFLLKIRKKQLTFYLTVFWLLILLIKTIMILYYDVSFSSESYILKFSILIGLAAVWSLFDNVFKNSTIDNRKLNRLTEFTFIIFAFHEPLQTIIKQFLMNLFKGSEIMSVFIYFFTTFFVITVSVFLGLFLKRFVPIFYNLITGNR